jgi:hypothetical protein
MRTVSFYPNKLEYRFSRSCPTGRTPPVLLRSANPDHHHWVEMKLVGGPKSLRDATCATVYLKANGMCMRQDVLASGSDVSSIAIVPAAFCLFAACRHEQWPHRHSRGRESPYPRALR